MIYENESEWQLVTSDLISAAISTAWKDSSGVIRKKLWIGGYTSYFDNDGYLHRENGPASFNNDHKSWYWHGSRIDCNSQEEFEKFLKLKAFW